MKHISLLLQAFFVISLSIYAPIAEADSVIEIFITEGDDYDLIELYDLYFPMAAIMTGGHVGDETDGTSGMHVYQSNTCDISGGTVDYLHMYDSSTAYISGGTVSHYDCWDTQTITANDYSTINIYDGGFLDGGSFHIFDLYDSSTVNIYGGDVHLFLYAHNYSTVNSYDGDCYLGIIPHDYSTTNVYGGYVGSYAGDPPDETATVNIYGYAFNYDPNARWCGNPNEGYWIGKLTGYGCEGIAIEYWGLPDPNMHENINLIPDFIPARGVNLADFAVFASAWKTQEGDAKWNNICDVSDPNDNMIDERDLAVLTKYWSAGIE